MSEPSILDARLAEIDRRLRVIQSGLEPALGPSGGPPPEPSAPFAPDTPPDTPPEPAPAPAQACEDPDRLIARLRELIADQERLLTSIRQLQSALAEALAAAPPSAPAQPAPPSEPPHAPPPPGAQTAPGAVSVSAGPFADTAAVRSFQRALSRLPEVGEAVVREYQGEDRAVVEVRLRGSIS
jgi:uncharacterized coiled-coil protein SlyX